MGAILLYLFVGSTSDGPPPTISIPGIEFTSPEDRLHFVTPSARLHFTAPEDRLHFTTEET